MTSPLTPIPSPPRGEGRALSGEAGLRSGEGRLPPPSGGRDGVRGNQAKRRTKGQ